MKVLLFFFFSFLISCTKDYTVTKLALNKSTERVEIQHPLPEVDILFVLDTQSLSPSFREDLVTHVDRLVEPLWENGMIDFRFGVVGTSLSKERRNVCGGGLLAGNPRSLNRGTVNFLQVLKRNLQRGESCQTDSSSHRPFESVKRVLENPLTYQGNKGFYRTEASLALVFVTERRGEGDMEVDQFKNFLLNLKKGDMSKIALYGAIITKDNPLGCLVDENLETLPLEVEKAVTHFRGLSFDLCSSYFEEEMAKVGENLSQRFGEVFVPFEQVPATGTIDLRYRGYPLQKNYERGWSYDPNRKGIRVGPNTRLPRGTFGGFLEISFDVADPPPRSQLD